MKYEEVVKLWGAKKLRDEGITFIEVTSVNFDTTSDRGSCPTCGPDYYVEASVWYSTTNGITGSAYKDFEFYGLEDILRDLFEVSEP